MSEVRQTTSLIDSRFLNCLKLQFFSSGNWEGRIADSGLPDHAQSVVREVVSRTGLLRFEKAEIANELIHHFQDGHERGRSWEELVRDFGKVDIAVSLFRSSKLRSRPMSVKAFRGSFMTLGGGLIGYLLLQLFFHSAKPNPSVDYAAMLNEAATSPPVEQQAWPHYRDLWIKYGLVGGGGESFKEMYVKKDDDIHHLVRATDKEWDDALAKLESVKELVDAWREHSRLPHLGTPLHVDKRNYSDDDLRALFPHLADEEIERPGVDWGLQDGILSEEATKLLDGSVVGVMLPHVQQFRQAADILHVDTRLAVTQGDCERAVENIKAIHGLATQAADAPLFVCALVGYAIHGIGFGVTEETIVENPEFFDEKHLTDLQRHVEGLELPDLKKVEFEQNLAMDLVQRIYSDDGDGDGRITAVGAEVKYACTEVLFVHPSKRSSWLAAPLVRSVTAPVNLFSAPSREDMELMIEAAYEKWGDRMSRPMWEKDSLVAWEKYLDHQDDSGFLKSLLSGIGNTKNVREVKLAYLDAVRLALACHRYKKAVGQWPQSLDQLEGKWLKSTPIDRLHGKPLSFVIKDDAPVIYSLGHDGDDDGGVNTDSNAPWLERNGDGDWVVWPQADM